MRVVLDTSVLIDHLRGDERAVALLRGAVKRGDELWSVVVVRSEVLAGMRPREEADTLALLSVVRWQDITIELADRAGALGRQYLKSHPGVDTVDYLIAAGAQLLGAELKTLNVKHFPMIKELKPAYEIGVRP